MLLCSTAHSSSLQYFKPIVDVLQTTQSLPVLGKQLQDTTY